MNYTFTHLIKIALKNPRRLTDSIWRKLGIAKKTKASKQYSTYFETECLMRYAHKSQYGIVEIGVLDGGNSREMALVASVPIYGIDPLIPDSMDANLQGERDHIDHNLSFYPDFHFYQDYSFNVVKNWSHMFDFIWIDGDHTYEAVRQDFEDWYPLLAADGYIAFHDSAPVKSTRATHKGYPGPIKLVTELKADDRVRYVETCDSITIFQKQ